MLTVLGDAFGLVRWRATRFLNELGDASAIEPLTQAAEAESEFDVRIHMGSCALATLAEEETL